MAEKEQKSASKAAEKKETIGAKIVHGVVTGAKTVAGKLPVKTAKQPTPREPRTKLLISVVNRDDELRLKEVLDDCSVALAFAFTGTGTAHSAVLDYLGIGQTEKAILGSLIPETDERILLKAIREKMSLYRVGRGISFTIPLSGISQIVAKGLNAAATEKTMEGKTIMKQEDRKYDLVVASVAVNFVDLAMEAARAAGAAGGTVLRARSTSNAKAEQFIGLTLLREREILLVLTKRQNTAAMLQALGDRVGLKTEAGGVIFALPVDRTAGVDAVNEQLEEREDRKESEQISEQSSV